MVGRNDPCPCGSGKKYKKCCESKQNDSIEEVKTEELERVLQSFYDHYPERKNMEEYADLVRTWSKATGNYLDLEMLEAIVMDEFFFHYKQEIWSGYLEKQKKLIVRPSTLNTLSQWNDPKLFVGKVEKVDEHNMTATHILTKESILLRRESDKPIPIGVHVYCFILPDGTGKENHYLAISSLVFFPVDHQVVFDTLVKEFEKQETLSASAFLKETGADLWKLLGENGYEGGEYTRFEVSVLQVAIDFLEKNNREYGKFIEIVEDYLVEQQPNARKEVAIAAGAIRFGQENGLFEPFDMTIKEIAETFEVSTSSLNKYYNDLTDYYKAKQFK